MRNVGDAIAPQILEHAGGVPAFWDFSAAQPHILSIGSLIHTATPQSFVWGTGLLHPSLGVGDPDPSRILAVRGKLTYAQLVAGGVRLGDIPLGDPGVLIARLMPRRDPAEPCLQLGLVPHYMDRDHPFFVRAADNPDVRVLDVCKPPETFLADLQACAAVASTSLHGLIFAEALGLPTLWLKASDKVLGDGFKFADWFSLAANPQRAPYQVGEDLHLSEIAARCEWRGVHIDADALVRALSRPALEGCHGAPISEGPWIPVAACRRQPLPVFLVLDGDADQVELAVAWLKEQSRPVRIILCHEPAPATATRALLATWEKQGCALFALERPIGPHPVDWAGLLAPAVTRFFENWAEPCRYAVTGCRVALSHLSASALDLYDDLLDRFPRADGAGPKASSTPLADQELVIPARASRPEDTMTLLLEPYRCEVRDVPPSPELAVYRPGGPLPPSLRMLRVCSPH